ncbi:DNA glycosylase/AP lyase [Boletus edulis BED1]|uniref:DNA glycosylase/AP lyase n=1 Tax=Boletus edulis BED1 TaxID=1328754 RepID=A0AAD4C1W9_BOLED|nr:DNA glycosylase/AP lyase [Boletus edulis BED1]
MPELPEVERAVALISSVAKGKLIHHVDTFEDELVYSGLTHHQFAGEIAHRTIIHVARYGKYFYIQLDGEGRMPVFHFGMTGMLMVRGQPTPCYKSSPRNDPDAWPPRFVKFILFIREDHSSFTELAFCDARRLGRIRMVCSPSSDPPISDLGFDPILSMPSLEDFRRAVSTRTCPIKALLLDQSFSAGIGNYLADEILYQAQLHPEQRCNTLDACQILALHHQIADICRITVDVNADDTKYPPHWLFHHRWGKGKKTNQTMKLPSGEPATVKWITVGGRTSAYVVQVQKPYSREPQQDTGTADSSNVRDTSPRRSKRRRMT